MKRYLPLFAVIALGLALGMLQHATNERARPSARVAMLTALASVSDPLFNDGFESLASCPTQIVPLDGAPRRRLTTSPIRYGSQGGTKPVVDVREWDNVWGHGTVDPREPVTPWPGVTGSAPVLLSFQRTSYVALHFKTPAAPAHGLAGRFFHPTAYPGGPDLTIAISRACGDFAYHLPTPGCLQEDVPSADAPMMYWQFASTSPLTACNLSPATDYYVNIMQSDPLSQVECTTATCPALVWKQ